MNTQKIFIGGIIGGVVYFFLGWLIWGIILGDTLTMAECVSRGDENMILWAMALSCILWGLIIAYILGKWASISTFSGGLKAGALLGAVITLCFGLGQYSMLTSTTLQDIVLNVISDAVASGIIGGIIGWWLGRK